MSARYTLTRWTPDGIARQHSPVTSVRMAAVLAARVLVDNTSTSKKDAQRFSLRLESAAGRGEIITHEPTGYAFRIDRHLGEQP